MLGRLIAKINVKRNNDAVRPEGFINGQGICTVHSFRFGLGTVAANGCGAIAVYNALKLCGYTADFTKIASGLEKSGLVLFGWLGVAPDGIGRYFRKAEISARKLHRYDEFVKSLENGGVYILCYWTRKPWRSTSHFVAIEHRDGNNIVYNLYNNSKTERPVGDIANICNEGQFIRAYVMEKK
ncbi:MAG: hypothetical protein J6I96_06645 [Oscillospiraceae bacterium]|nr:hypothetical protein [Oscillospiraceae bacterium]